jgi:hypothetical protein
MIDERFSCDAFERLGRNTPAAEELAKTLRSAIDEAVFQELRAMGERIALRLRELGHVMTEVEAELDPVSGAGVTFVDTSAGSSRDAHRLRFNLDLVVSTGYPGYVDAEEIDG